jgi:pSer/pThr/pTyr-binding forkhead associated (FHA) protein
VPESLLTILKFCFLALLYLFLLRVVRAVWVEIAGPRPGKAAPRAAGYTTSGRTRRDRGGRSAPRLRVVEPADQRGRAYELADELTVGRAPGCQIALNDTYASQLHARIFRKDGQLFVEDLGSTNGTYLNRKKVTAPMPLRRGDRLQVGKTVMEVSR